MNTQMDNANEKTVKLEIFTHNRIKYISGDYVFHYAKGFIGNTNIVNTRQLIKAKNIADTDYTFARLKDDKWIISTNKSARYDKVFFTKEYVDKISEITSIEEYVSKTSSKLNILKMHKKINSNMVVDKNNNFNCSTSTSCTSNTSVNPNSINSSHSSDDIMMLQNINGPIQDAPSIFILNADQKFRDDNGNVIELETRGTCTFEGILFNVDNVSEAFEFKNLKRIITNDNTTYCNNEHFKICCIKKKRTKNTTNNEYITNLFLTYLGLIKVIFCSHGEKTKKFMKWATETLFIHQMGNIEQKRLLASGLLGVSSQVVKEMFKINDAETPCFYLLYIGNAKKLLGNGYSDNQMLCKFGHTCDLPRRVSEHQTAFGIEFSVTIELLHFSIVDKQFTSKAEDRVKDYFGSRMVSYKNMVELFVIDTKDLPSAKQYYDTLQETFIGQFRALNDENVRLTNNIVALKSEFDNNMIKIIAECDRKIAEKDAECKALLYEKDAECKALLCEKDKEIVQTIIQCEKLLAEKDREIVQTNNQCEKLLAEKDREIVELKNVLTLRNKDFEILQQSHEIAMYKYKETFSTSKHVLQ